MIANQLWLIWCNAFTWLPSRRNQSPQVREPGRANSILQVHPPRLASCSLVNGGGVLQSGLVGLRTSGNAAGHYMRLLLPATAGTQAIHQLNSRIHRHKWKQNRRQKQRSVSANGQSSLKRTMDRQIVNLVRFTWATCEQPCNGGKFVHMILILPIRL